MGANVALLLFSLANLLVVAFGSMFTGLSYLYQSSGRRAVYRDSTLGFALITAGGVVEPFYQLVLGSDYYTTGQELLELQAAEGALVGLGVGLHLPLPRAQRARPSERSRTSRGEVAMSGDGVGRRPRRRRSGPRRRGGPVARADGGV